MTYKQSFSERRSKVQELERAHPKSDERVCKLALIFALENWYMKFKFSLTFFSTNTLNLGQLTLKWRAESEEMHNMIYKNEKKSFENERKYERGSLYTERERTHFF